MTAAQKEGKRGEDLQRVEDDWLARARLARFDDLVLAAINDGSYADKPALQQSYLTQAKGRSSSEARDVARRLLGRDLYFDWDAPRTREGFYRLRGGCELAIVRAVAYGPYCDAVWMESKLPDYEQAREFAQGVHAAIPHQK